MTTRYYGVALGAQKASDVTEGSSTTSKPTELVVVTSTTGYDKHEVLLQLDAIKQRILQDNWPPA